MARITVTDVVRLWDNYRDVATAVGFDVSGWTIVAGSPSSGTLWTGRTADHKPIPGAWANGWESAFLGRTAAETYAALQHAMSAMRAVAALHH